MKKLLAVATIAVVGYKVVKKIKERKNEVEINEDNKMEIYEGETIEADDIEIINENEDRIRYEKIKKVIKPIMRPFIYVAVYGLMIVKVLQTKIEDNKNKEAEMDHIIDRFKKIYKEKMFK